MTEPSNFRLPDPSAASISLSLWKQNEELLAKRATEALEDKLLACERRDALVAAFKAEQAR